MFSGAKLLKKSKNKGYWYGNVKKYILPPLYRAFLQFYKF